VLSIGESFMIETFQKPSLRNATRCNVASTFDVTDEVDTIVNDILENNDVVFTTNSTSTDKYYTGHKFTGLDLLNACNTVAAFKNKRLDVDGKTIQLRDNLLNEDYTNIILSEKDTDTQLVSIKRNKSSYDQFNEIIIYGDGVKGIARDRKNIKDRNSIKTKEIVDLSISNETIVSDKARNLLNVYKSLNNQITFTIPRTKIPYLKVGQIIGLDYPTEHIPRNDYSVVDLKYKYNGLIEVTVGEYKKDLTHAIADLIIENKKQAGDIRGSRFVAATPALTEAIEPKIKERRITITSSTTTSYTFGFTEPFGFTRTFSFSAPSDTKTVILDEDLSI
jgi:hypothetical protein